MEKKKPKIKRSVERTKPKRNGLQNRIEENNYWRGNRDCEPKPIVVEENLSGKTD